MTAATVDQARTTLELHHALIEALFARVIDSPPEARADAEARLKLACELHDAFEQEVVHPNVLSSGRELADPVVHRRQSEEASVRRDFSQLGAEPAESEDFAVDLVHLLTLVKHHHRQEELHEFPLLAPLGPQSRAWLDHVTDQIRQLCDGTDDVSPRP